MKKMARRKYSPEFKTEAVLLVTEKRYNTAEAARNLGINATLLGRWVKQSEDMESSTNGNLKVDQEELRRLRSENKRLKMEREILKKAAAFFAKESN